MQVNEIETMNTSIFHRTVIVAVILLSRSFQSDWALAEGCPTPNFIAARTFGAGRGAWSLAVGDLDRDGHSDLAVANRVTTNISVLLGNGDGTFQAAVNYSTATNPVSVAVADFNGDSKPDLAVVSLGSTNVAVRLGNGDGTFQSAVEYAAGTNLNSVAVGDFNGDGKADLLVAGSTVSVLLGNGDGTV